MDYQVRPHPTLGILVRSNGEVFVPANGPNKAHWTFGSKNRLGYFRVRINGHAYSVHRLVAETFIPNPENKPEIDHINRNPSDNRISPVCNLRWCTRSENNRNTSSHERVEARGGTHWYEGKKSYNKEHYQTHKQNYRESRERFCNTHKYVLFSDGKQRWVSNEQATELLKLPVKERV